MTNMKDELINTVDNALNKDREYKHSTKKDLETKNRKKTIERKTQYKSAPTTQSKIYLDRVASSFEVMSLSIDRMLTTTMPLEELDRGLKLIKELCDMESMNIRYALSTSDKNKKS